MSPRVHVSLLTARVAAAHGQVALRLVAQRVGEVQVDVGDVQHPAEEHHHQSLTSIFLIPERLPPGPLLPPGSLPLLGGDVDGPAVDLLPGAAAGTHDGATHLPRRDAGLPEGEWVLATRAGNEGQQSFHNHGDRPY